MVGMLSTSILTMTHMVLKLSPQNVNYELTMTQDDKEALKEFLRGVSVVIGFLVAFILFIAILGAQNEPPNSTNSRTKVVGRYENCDIVQWQYDPLTEYHYFLHCPINGSPNVDK